MSVKFALRASEIRAIAGEIHLRWVKCSAKQSVEVAFLALLEKHYSDK